VYLAARSARSPASPQFAPWDLADGCQRQGRDQRAGTAGTGVSAVSAVNARRMAGGAVLAHCHAFPVPVEPWCARPQLPGRSRACLAADAAGLDFAAGCDPGSECCHRSSAGIAAEPYTRHSRAGLPAYNRVRSYIRTSLGLHATVYYRHVLRLLPREGDRFLTRLRNGTRIRSRKGSSNGAVGTDLLGESANPVGATW